MKKHDARFGSILDILFFLLRHIHMKPTNLMLDEDNLRRATKILGVKTYSEAVNRALMEIIRLAEVREMVAMMGTIEWEGDLEETRGDAKKTKRKRW